MCRSNMLMSKWPLFKAKESKESKGNLQERLTVLSMTSCARALSYMSTVTPRSEDTFAESSSSRALFWRSRSYASDILN